MTSPTIRRAATACLALLAVATLGGCYLIGINERAEVSFATYEEVMSSSEGIRIPDLVPEDAREVRLAYNTLDEGSAVAFDSDGGLTAEYCAESTVEVDPPLDPSWWPEAPEQSGGWTCGDWSVIEVEDTFYTWR